MDIFKNENGFAPLKVNLEGYWEKSLAELPRHLRAIVEKRYALYPWDDRNPEQRRNLAAQYDYQHDPNHEPIMYYELVKISEELVERIEKARQESKADVELTLRDIAKRIDDLLDIDRDLVGSEIQELRTIRDRKAAGDNSMSDKLGVLNRAARTFWSNYTPKDRSTEKKNSEVESWLTTRGYSQRLAKAGATIIRPDQAPSGSKPGR